MKKRILCDGNEAAASVAYRLSELVSIYPITPSSPMAELSDEWSASGQKNIWGSTPNVSQMQSEGGVAGAVHGILQGGVLSTTFTASQGLLLMIPNMYKIAGELSAFCMHVSARSLASHALSIFGDHSDVMACRQTGFAMLASGSVQEAHDMACIAHAATLKSSVPFLHFFDGFRTSHEINTIEFLEDEILQQMIDDETIATHRKRALNPEKPIIRGTAQNPDVFFQAREAVNSFYKEIPKIVQEQMDLFAKLTGRQYNLFDYVGDPEAKKVIILMGSGGETASETAKFLEQKGEKVGVLKVRLYRPFSIKNLIQILPKTTEKIAVLDRTKEPGSAGEPLYKDVVSGMNEAHTEGWLEGERMKIIGGRYGLGSKEFTPSMVNAIYQELDKEKPKNHFTVGINDDVSKLSIKIQEQTRLFNDDTFNAVFFGLGSDGTVGANKNTIKIIGQETNNHAQAYFVYDSKKSGAMTVSHLRFGKNPIQAPYLIEEGTANFVACHQPQFLDNFDLLDFAKDNGIFLLNTTHDKNSAWNHLPEKIQKQILDKRLKFFAIDAYHVAKEAGMGNRINTVMQTCFFAISGVLKRNEALEKIKESIQKTYAKKGEKVVQQNFEAVNKTIENLHEIDCSEFDITGHKTKKIIPDEAPEFVRYVTAEMIANKGDSLPVSVFAADGSWPTSTTKWEKRNVAQEIPNWNKDLCIQCNRCALICPHAAIRAKFYDKKLLENAPEEFKHLDFRTKGVDDQAFTIQVSPKDCTGCGLCVEICPGKDKQNPSRKALQMETKTEDFVEKNDKMFEFFEKLPYPNGHEIQNDMKSIQFKQPLFEFSGACAGCGETPYIKLLTQLFGDRMLIANATGCSSIYGGNLPTTPYCVNQDGRGPTWSNSLFEDNAEFGLGLRLAVDKKKEMAREILKEKASDFGDDLVSEILEADQSTEKGIHEQRERINKLKEILREKDLKYGRQLELLTDCLVEKSVWAIGGDGWAYDIGYGGLDHVIASGKNIKLLVLDTEVYSNTGGQQSKATPLGAMAKFAAAGKSLNKKDLGLLAISYGNIYVAQVAMGAKPNQTLQAFKEANEYNGPALIIAYSHCIAHGYNLEKGLAQQELAVKSGYWPLYRFNPNNITSENTGLKLDSQEPSIPVAEYMINETRFKSLQRQNPERANELFNLAQKMVKEKFDFYKKLTLKKI